MQTSEIVLTVKDEAGNDYSADFSLTVVDGRLVLVNSNPAVFFIRIEFLRSRSLNTASRH